MTDIRLSEKIEEFLINLFEKKSNSIHLFKECDNSRLLCDVSNTHSEMIRMFNEVEKYIVDPNDKSHFHNFMNGYFYDYNSISLNLENKYEYFNDVNKYNNDTKLLILEIIAVFNDDYDIHLLIRNLNTISNDKSSFEILLIKIYLMKILNVVYYRLKNEKKISPANDKTLIETIMNNYGFKIFASSGCQGYFNIIINSFITNICEELNSDKRLNIIYDFERIVYVLEKWYFYYINTNDNNIM
jgi:hypothetical protein